MVSKGMVGSVRVAICVGSVSWVWDPAQGIVVFPSVESQPGVGLLGPSLLPIRACLQPRYSAIPSPCGDKASGECRYKPSHIMVRVGHRARLRVEHPIDLSWNSQRPRLDHPPLVPIGQDIGQSLRKLLLQQAVHQLAFTKGVCQRCHDGVLRPEGPTTGSTPISRWKRKWWGRSASDPTSQYRQHPDFERVEPYGTCAIGSPA